MHKFNACVRFLTNYLQYKDGFSGFIDLNISADTFIFIDKEKSRKLSNPAKVQFFGKLEAYDFDTIIRQTRAIVKGNGRVFEEKPSSLFILRKFSPFHHLPRFSGASWRRPPTGTVEDFALSVGCAATITPKEEFLPK